MATKTMNPKMAEVAARLRELREIAGLTVDDAAQKTGFPAQEYASYETGEEDVPYSFLLNCAELYGVGMSDLLEGTSTARLSGYTVTRAGAGRVTASEHGHDIRDLAPLFREKLGRPYMVRYAYAPDAETAPTQLDTHEGHEFDYVVSGSLRVQVGPHIETLGPGDSIYYNSGTPHGMVAVGGADCEFIAVVLHGHAAEGGYVDTPSPAFKPKSDDLAIWHKFADVVEDEKGSPLSVKFKNTETFNFAFDVVDALAAKVPKKLAMLHVDRDKVVRRFTYEDLSRMSSRAANYFESLGVNKGDRVMLVLKRNWQFWITLLALHKIGAIMIPAPDQLLEHDFDYRFEAGRVKALITTGQSGAWMEAEKSIATHPGVEIRVMVNGAQPGWRDFDNEYEKFRSSYPRKDDTPCGNETGLMFFSSGTTGYPKLVTHTHTYPLGHFVTAKYWHNVDPDGIHFTISDTGWGKSLWGKIYGQWLCEAAVFTYDFDRFEPADVLPMFAEHGITTFCAPPTIYRYLIREDITKYDLSGIKYATTAGEALNPEVFNIFKEATGLSIMEGFGQTETTLLICNYVGMTPKIGSMGKSSPAYNVDVINPDGTTCAAGETGEIVVRIDDGKPCGLFLGYIGPDDKLMGEKYDAAWRGGVFHTGDTAWRDEEGFFFYVGRVDDIIKSSGYRIGPFEIESVIMELPYVLECGVSAVPDEIRGQVVKASVVLAKNSGREPNDELKKEIQQYVKTHTAPYKYPRVVVFRDELPKTINGKIQRNKL